MSRRLDTDAIARRLAEPVGVRQTKGALYLTLTRTRNDCAALLAEVGRQRDSLVAVSTLLSQRIEQLEQQLHHGQPMNPSGEAVDDASAPYGLAQKNTGSGAGPDEVPARGPGGEVGRPQTGSSEPPPTS